MTDSYPARTNLHFRRDFFNKNSRELLIRKSNVAAMRRVGFEARSSGAKYVRALAGDKIHRVCAI